jgi:NAD(P)-dependent dehydrogenase (short-subunit alcohol dehydrogenase family)
MKKVWFITGSSRGLGRAIAQAVLDNGDFVAASVRKKETLKDLEEKYPDQILTLALDVTVKAQIVEGVTKTIEKFGRIDVLLNNAGFGITGAFEAYTDEQVRSQLNTNLYGAIEVAHVILPYMRKQKSGRIFNVSSIGGRVGNAGLTMYQAAKFGLSGFSEALAHEVAPLNIKVIALEPGGMDTDWGKSSMTFAKEIEGYEKTVGVMETVLKQLANMTAKYGGDLTKIAKMVIELSEEPNPPIHMVIGKDAYNIVKQGLERNLAEMERWKAKGDATDYDTNETLFDETGKTPLH